MLDRLAGPAAHGHLHVGLSAAVPHLADEDVVENGLFAVREGDFVGSAGLGRRDAGEPLPVCAGRHDGFLFGPGGRNGDLLARGGAPYGDILLLLEDHMVAEDGRQFNFCLKGCRGQKPCGQDHESFHTLICVPLDCNGVLAAHFLPGVF